MLGRDIPNNPIEFWMQILPEGGMVNLEMRLMLKAQDSLHYATEAVGRWRGASLIGHPLSKNLYTKPKQRTPKHPKPHNVSVHYGTFRSVSADHDINLATE